MIIIYVLLHITQVGYVMRKWHLLIMELCPTRVDYLLSNVNTQCQAISATLNAFFFVISIDQLRRMCKSMCNRFVNGSSHLRRTNSVASEMSSNNSQCCGYELKSTQMETKC